MSPIPPGGRGGEGVVSSEPGPVARAGGTRGSCPPSCSHNRTPFFHLPCSLHNHLTGGVLLSEARFSGLLRFALLAPAAQDYLPKSKQKGLTLPRKRRLSCIIHRSVPGRGRQGALGTHGRRNALVSCRCGRVWHSFRRY